MNKPSVLWIEDSARFELRSLVGPLLFSGKYDFNLAEDVTSAMHFLRAKEYAGVIVDIRLPPGIDPEWRRHYRESGANKVQSQLGLKLLYWLLGKNPSIHPEAPPAWVKPWNIGVFTVESQKEIQTNLDELEIVVFKQKAAGLPDTILLDLINELVAKAKLDA